MAELSSFQLFPTTIRDPSYQPTRLLCINTNTSLVCHENSVYVAEIDSNTSSSFSSSSSSDSAEYNTGNVTRSNSFYSKSLNGCELPTSKTIQSICRVNNSNNSRNLVSTIDSTGTVNILQYQSQTVTDKDSFQLNPLCSFQTSPSKYEIGWTGLTQTADDRLVSCHYLSRELIWSDIESQSVYKRILLPGNPTCVSSSSDNPHLIFTGDNNGRFNVWDVRQTDKDCCLHSSLSNRSGDSLYSILQLHSNSVAITGSEKSLQLIDMRTWKGRFKMTTPCKYDVIHLLRGFSDRLYLAGRDNEILSCELPAENIHIQKKRKNNPSIPPTEVSENNNDKSSVSKLHVSHQRGVRGESYWCGLDLVRSEESENSERIVGLCGKGKMYVLNRSNEMKVASNEERELTE